MPKQLSPEDVRKAVADDYGQYICTNPAGIYIGNARAFNPGEAVPASHVERGVVSPNDVAKTTTKAGREALAETQEA